MQEWLDSELQCQACGLNLPGAMRSLRAKLAGGNRHSLNTRARDYLTGRLVCGGRLRGWAGGPVTRPADAQIMEGEGRHLTRGRALNTGKARQGAQRTERSHATRHWPFPKARGSNTKHYILPLGMANRMRLRMRMDSQSQSHALSRSGCALQRSCLSSLAAGQTGGGGGLRLPIKLNYV